ncbi:MAG: ABC transporter permease [Candidatus Tectomicrobia bacterium]|nr:ABC transporter permease [Candidatus Tectomicrobia bacterium]
MRRFLLRRLLLLLPVLWGVSTLVFLVTHVIPGDPVDLMLGETARPAQREEMRKALGLDRPLLAQYGEFLGGLARGDLGSSLHQKRPVASLLAERAPATAELAAASLAVAMLIAFPLGMAAARRAGSWLDLLAGMLAVLGASLPVFWLGPLLIIAFSLGLGWLPVSGRTGPLSLVLPAATLGMALAAILMRMARSSLLEVLPQDYLSAARAKGLSEGRVLWLHALRNACLPLITILGIQMGALLSGAIITETVFAWPGVGRLTIQAIAARDYPVVQGCVLLIAGVYVAVNFAADLAYAWLDPRVRLD